MSAHRSRCLFVVVALTALIPHAGHGASTHEVGHWLGMYHVSPGTVLFAHVFESDGQVPSIAGTFRVDDISLKVVNCLEFEEARDGDTVAYASFAPVEDQGRETDWAFVQVLLEDGLATQADLGLSENRTSTDRCGAGEVKVKKVDAFVWKQAASL